MTQRPTIRILVDGVEQLRDAYFEHETVTTTVSRTPSSEWSAVRLVPVLLDNEVLRETIHGYMEIITIKKP